MRRSHFRCLDCGIDTLVIDEYFMIQDVLWKQITSSRERKSILCVDCVERRIGRSLNVKDFKPCELTRQKITSSEKLMSRYNSQIELV